MTDIEEKILCPKCEWEPDGKPHWTCHCGHRWNTFATYGKCPSCGHVHKTTQCPSCHAFSPHPDWYVLLEGVDIAMEKEAEEPLG